MKRKGLFLVLGLVLFMTSLGISQEKKRDITKFSLEYGFVGVYTHTIQFGTNGTMVDYISDGGQQNLYPIAKFSFEWMLSKKHSLIFLYQPLTVETESVLQRDITVDNVTFSSNTPMSFKYGFDFYRLSYLFNLIDNSRFKWDIGISVQIRDASIIFRSQDGTLAVENQGLGIVPILKTRALLNLSDLYYLEAEIDGFYASSRIFNGTTDTDFVGSILDANLRLGWHLTPEVDSALVLRALGGGALGTENAERYDGLGDGYTENNLGTVSVALNVSYTF